jgi:hypothetical protein
MDESKLRRTRFFSAVEAGPPAQTKDRLHPLHAVQRDRAALSAPLAP